MGTNEAELLLIENFLRKRTMQKGEHGLGGARPGTKTAHDGNDAIGCARHEGIGARAMLFEHLRDHDTTPHAIYGAVGIAQNSPLIGEIPDIAELEVCTMLSEYRTERLDLLGNDALREIDSDDTRVGGGASRFVIAAKNLLYACIKDIKRGDWWRSAKRLPDNVARFARVTPSVTSMPEEPSVLSSQNLNDPVCSSRKMSTRAMGI